jgi:hypothetical protein
MEPTKAGPDVYDEMERNELLAEASQRGIANPHEMRDPELRDALRVEDVPNDGDSEVSVETDWPAPVSPTRGVPTPSEQPGRLGPVEAAPPQSHLVTNVKSVKGGRKGTLSTVNTEDE